ncbi:hypothetical protein A1O3_00533 [Capronia epimyces CBS 606.96]|uniref:Initiation-specific alpha-1,6-mannosyltransferase n=1 Tax=Capronia epimyces CBS 606.96 TaxID=1182542 RepID=W9YHG9_9EURO|nr:uncharacterized protein A1O3_00533 [Capronia epimyces CBS 606.96]EXJ91983.1 hypothetical protein A1O3_00533 [Capronia epimyces CBS 606.96]
MSRSESAAAAPPPPPPPIPHKIWQIWLQPADAGPDSDTAIGTVQSQHAHLTASWTTHNPGWTRRLLDNDSAREFVVREFHAHADIMLAWTTAAAVPILQADLLRYLVLYIEGGVYADLDAECVKGVDEWPVDWTAGPEPYGVELLVGVEYDKIKIAVENEIDYEIDYDSHQRLEERQRFPDDMQFATWTIAAKPRSQLLWAVIQEIAHNLNSNTPTPAGKDKKGEEEEVELDLDRTPIEPRHAGSLAGSLTESLVMDLTGPRAFTRALFRALTLRLRVDEKTKTNPNPDLNLALTPTSKDNLQSRPEGTSKDNPQSRPEGASVGHADLTGLTEPKAIGGLVVLPVTAFACEQPHSNAGRWTDPDVLVIHKYHHSWAVQVQR